MRPHPPSPAPAPSPAPSPATPGPGLRVADLAVGEQAIVTGVKAPCRDVERLAALGLVPGAVVRMLRQGATLAIAVGATRLALGRSWARALAVARV